MAFSPSLSVQRYGRFFVPSGVVKWYNEASGYGFIVPDEGGSDLFVRGGSVEGDNRVALSEGERVEFEPREGGMGPEAIDVLRVPASEEREAAEVAAVGEAALRR
jgi:CspA family cold shock protein